MATAISTITGPVQSARQATLVGSAGNTVAFATDWTRFVDTDIIAQVNGTATVVVASVERSVVDPTNQSAQSAPADSDGFSGNLSTGIPPNIYTESGVGWWRINVTTVTGGTCTATLSGKD